MKLIVKRTKDGNRELPYWETPDNLTVERVGASVLVKDNGDRRILTLNKKEANRLASTILKLTKLLE